jgi:hypothetical protein
MKKYYSLLITGCMFLVILSIGNSVFAGSEKFDEKMQPVLAEYFKITENLASDKTDGVADSAKKIESLSGNLSASFVTGEHASHYNSISKNIAEGAKKMALAKEIVSMRTALVDLSKPMVMWASLSKPSGINVVYCSMNPGSWLQKGSKIRNPYYGSKMLSCGQIIPSKSTKK